MPTKMYWMVLSSVEFSTVKAVLFLWVWMNVCPYFTQFLSDSSGIWCKWSEHIVVECLWILWKLAYGGPTFITGRSEITFTCAPKTKWCVESKRCLGKPCILYHDVRCLQSSCWVKSFSVCPTEYNFIILNVLIPNSSVANGWNVITEDVMPAL